MLLRGVHAAILANLTVDISLREMHLLAEREDYGVPTQAVSGTIGSMLSALLLPILRERFPDRGLIEGTAPEPIAAFPGIYPAIHRLAIYDDRHELTVSIEPLMHGHFAEYDATLSKKEREQRIVESVVEFLEAVFADHLAVWSKGNSAGWSRIDFSSEMREPDVQEYVWSGSRRYDSA